MKKVFVLIFFCLFLMFQISCKSSSVQVSEQTVSKTPESSQVIEPSINKTPEFPNKRIILNNSPEGPIDEDSSMDYGAVIEWVCYKDEFRQFSGILVGFKRKTIKPENVEILKSNPDISPETLENFIQRNQKTKRLIDGYDVKYGLQVIDKTDSYENLIDYASKKYPDLKSIIGLSRIGFNEDRTQSLTYFEFYGSDHQLKKNYILLTWDYSQGGARVKDVKWFPADK